MTRDRRSPPGISDLPASAEHFARITKSASHVSGIAATAGRAAALGTQTSISAFPRTLELMHAVQSLPGFVALESSIASQMPVLRDAVLRAADLSSATRVAGAAIADAVAARQTYLSDAAAGLRALGVDADIRATGTARALAEWRAASVAPFQDLARQIQETHRSLRLALGPSATAAIADWGVRWKELDERQRRDAADLQRDGWWLVPSWPVTRAARLLTYRRENGKRALDRAICDIYAARNHRELREVVDSWMDVPVFRVRRAIIHEALSLHREGRYKASVPTLLPHIEGIVADVYEPDRRRSVNPGKLLSGQVEPDRFGRLIVDGVVTVLELVYGVAPFNSFSPRTRRLHRHLILHGGSLNYGSEVNSIKVFLILDVLASELRRSGAGGSRNARGSS